MFSAEIATECSRCSVGFSIENPRSSGLWRFGPIAKLLALPAAHYIDFHTCAYGAPYRKPTRLLTNQGCLDSLSRFCDKQHSHVVLAGSERIRQADGGFKWVSRTYRAGAYPPRLCNAFARALAGRLPAGALGSQPRFVDEWSRGLLQDFGDPHAAALRGEVDTAQDSPALTRAAAAIRAHGIEFARKGRGLRFGRSGGPGGAES